MAMGGILRGAVAMHARNGNVRITSFLLCLGLLSGLSSGLLGESLSLLPGHAPPTLPLTPHSATSLKQGTEPAAFAPVAQVAQVAQQVPAPAAAQDPGSVIRVSSNLVSVPVSVTDSLDSRCETYPPQISRSKKTANYSVSSAWANRGRHRSTWRCCSTFPAAYASVSVRAEGGDKFSEAGAQAGRHGVGLLPGPSVAPGRATDRRSGQGNVRRDGLATHTGTHCVLRCRDRSGALLGRRRAAGHAAGVVGDVGWEDNNSLSHDLGDALRELQRADCLFYSINPSGPAIRLNPISLKGQQAMAALAEETGGAFVPATPQELEAALGQIASELQAQYLLGYYSKEVRQDGEFRPSP